MKLFQIEEPDGPAADTDAPGAAVGIDVTGVRAEVAVAVGGNAVVLSDRDGFELDLTVPSASAAVAEWQALLERTRLRAERALARPVTHAVVIADGNLEERLKGAAAETGLILLLTATPDAIGSDEEHALLAAALAEDLAPRAAAP